MAAAAGIYPDPSGEFAWRRWDGARWLDGFGAFTRVPPAAAAQQAAALLTASGATIQMVTAQMVVGSYHRKTQANPIAAVLLLLLCLIPGIVYLVLAGADEQLPFTIDVATHPSGSVLTANGLGAGLAMQALMAMRSALPPPPGAR